MTSTLGLSKSNNICFNDDLVDPQSRDSQGYIWHRVITIVKAAALATETCLSLSWSIVIA